MSGRSGERTVIFRRLDGGLNLWEQETELEGNESPEMQNLWWEDGSLQSREGQTYVTAQAEGAVGYAASGEPFWDRTCLHISGKLYALDHTAAPGDDRFYALEEVFSGVPRDRGTFFRYGEHLYYKNRGGFFRIAYTPEGEKLFTVTKVEDLAYTPTILLNVDPRTGSGDLYQPENRLTGRKRVKYNPGVSAVNVVKQGNGTSRVFALGASEASGLVGVETVYFGAEAVSPALYDVNLTTGTVTFTTAPGSGTDITFVLDFALSTYVLPEGDLDAVEEVRVDGVLLTPGEDYEADLLFGDVTFLEAPAEGENSVEIVYRKENPEAKASVMSCRYAAVYGGGVQVCMVLGGCAAQPNAIFWNGNDDLAMNPGYFPMPFYNLCGDSAETVTGFGKQYTELVVFKERSIGKTAFSVEEVNGRDSISLAYQRVNDKIGCDLPWSIQLIENNLVFANSRSGVHLLRSASAAYENNVSLVSRSVGGSDGRPGLLYDLRVAGGAVSFDDAQRYWLMVNGHAYVWDYRLSGGEKPCWFYFTNIHGVSWWSWGGKRFHLNAAGRVTELGRVFSDYGAGIPKVYRFPALNFGTYDRLKDVLRVIFTVRGDRCGSTRIRYKTDWEEREDPTPIRVAPRGLAPRDLTERDLGVNTFAVAAKRRPPCRRVRHFSMRLENDTAGEDLALLSARVVYRLLGRER